jgi:hypothetical protein
MENEYDEQLDRLFLAARSRKPDTAAVEEYFETRLMAKIEERQSRQPLWNAWSWRLVPWFATVVIIIGIVSAIYNPLRSSDLFAFLDNGDEEFMTASLLAGD